MSVALTLDRRGSPTDFPGAQHCLYARSLHTHEVAHGRNNLLQQHTYSEFDLADLARKWVSSVVSVWGGADEDSLDQAENALRNPGTGKKSYNYDDTGFFSISVLERALQVWDLTLVRWRGEAMRPYQENPECVPPVLSQPLCELTTLGTKPLSYSTSRLTGSPCVALQARRNDGTTSTRSSPMDPNGFPPLTYDSSSLRRRRKGTRCL